MNANIGLNDKDIVIYALYTLSGYEKRIHTEDIALKCFDIAPTRFSWAKHPQYPDIQPVRFALEKSKPFIVGSSERKQAKIVPGWRLTDEGVEWININKERIEKFLFGEQIPNPRLINNRKIKRLMESKGYKLFQANEGSATIPYADFVESLTCTVNTRNEVLLEKLEQLYSAASVLKQKEILNYLDHCRTYLKTMGVDNV